MYERREVGVGRGEADRWEKGMRKDEKGDAGGKGMRKGEVKEKGMKKDRQKRKV